MKRQPRLITLLTDFGLQDGYAAEMKGKMYSLFPRVKWVDVTHEIPPFQVAAGAWVLASAFKAFPIGTIHVAVVDPGVGGSRKDLILKAHGHYFVGPDNGIFSRVVQGTRYQAFQIKVPAGPICPTFHGRDVFAPTAALLAQGKSPARLGNPITGIRILDGLFPRKIGHSWKGSIAWIDRFGNAATTFHSSFWPRLKEPYLQIGRRRISAIYRTFEAMQPFAPGIIINSQGFLEIVMRQGSAAKLLGIRLNQNLWLKSREFKVE